MTQKELALSILKKAGQKGISPEDAKGVGITRLPARVYELKQDGHEIQAVVEQNGRIKTVRYIYLGELSRG